MRIHLGMLLSGLLLANATATAQTRPAAQPELITPLASRPASRPAQTRPATTSRAVYVTIDGMPIYDDEVEERLRREAPNEEHYGALMIIRDEIVGEMIWNLLMDRELAKTDPPLTISDAEVNQWIDDEFDAFLKIYNYTREQFDQELRQEEGMTLDDWLMRRRTDPEYRQALLRGKLVQQRFAEQIKARPVDIAEYYSERLDKRFRVPEQVRASHILFEFPQTGTAEQKAQIRKRAEKVLEEVRKPGADFAALASKHSDDSSRTRGGDIGYFPREGVVVSAVADAAFKLNVNEISGLVESPYGLHIIKVTDRKPERVKPLEEVRDAIRFVVEGEKRLNLANRWVAEMRSKAKIEWAPGKEPKTVELRPPETK